VWDVTVEGWFAPDGSSIEGLSIGAILDTTPADPLVEGGEPGALCGLAWEWVSYACIPCPDGSSDFCARVLVTGLTARPVEEVQSKWWPWEATTFDDLIEEIGDVALADPDCPETFPADCEIQVEICGGDRPDGAFVMPLVLLLLAPRGRRT